eukprot:TRINITY_DN7618_c0_g1_i1.p1 TRINITY_DN7618_c0_g1~~TRINITY_DN7618_c0_g1_i1.p1  ORF type:complete len:114 (-),score=22.91 TRINITY_DN7618_c0_g1_i1:407-724(-)
MASTDTSTTVPPAATPAAPPVASMPPLSEDGKVRNVTGSSAGSGSGDFHAYRAARRKEMIRLGLHAQEAEYDDMQAAFQKDEMERILTDEARTAKKRDKRKKAKS